MDINGARLITVHDKEKSLIEVRMLFTAHQGDISQALYEFDKEGTKEQEATALKAIENAKKLATMKERVKVVGRDSAPIEHKAQPRSFANLVPNQNKTPAEIRIGKGFGANGDKKFTVTLTIKPTKHDESMTIKVPFTGVAGSLEDKVFLGQLWYLTEGQRDVAKVMLEILNIPSTED
jgi:hypothetical protein